MTTIALYKIIKPLLWLSLKIWDLVHIVIHIPHILVCNILLFAIERFNGACFNLGLNRENGLSFPRCENMPPLWQFWRWGLSLAFPSWYSIWFLIFFHTPCLILQLFLFNYFFPSFVLFLPAAAKFSFSLQSPSPFISVVRFVDQQHAVGKWGGILPSGTMRGRPYIPLVHSTTQLVSCCQWTYAGAEAVFNEKCLITVYHTCRTHILKYQRFL